MTIEEAIQLTRGCAELLEFDPMTGEPTPSYRLEYEQAHAIRMVLAELETARADKQEHWIPFEFDEDGRLTGKLPEECERILICTNIGYVYVDEFLCDGDGFYLDSGWDLAEDVSAWMPLPEPFGGVENG